MNGWNLIPAIMTILFAVFMIFIIFDFASVRTRLLGKQSSSSSIPYMGNTPNPSEGNHITIGFMHRISLARVVLKFLMLLLLTRARRKVSSWWLRMEYVLISLTRR